MKVLIAEDDAVCSRVLKTALEGWGYEVITAPNGAEAWNLFDRDPVRIIVSDWMMPELDGLEFCKKVRARPDTEYTYFVLITVREGKENYHEAMDLGVDDFLAKPIDHDELSIRLRVANRILGFTTQIHRLESLLPICMYCKKIRDDKNDWNQIEMYISQRTETSFSHSICPHCYDAKVKPMLGKRKQAIT
jgi:phosphoserine phosphatase RsbU/P